MVSPSSLLRLLSFSARPPGRPSERKIQHVREAMLELLQKHEGQSFHRVAQRIRYADNETNYCPPCQTGGRLLADRGLSRLLKQDWPRSLEELEERRR